MKTSAEIDSIGKITAKSVLKYTGKNWNQWLEILDKSGARNWTHQEMTVFLRKKHKKVSLWWAHIVATGYEVYIGRKAPGRNEKGEYTVTVTKTFKIRAETLWKFLVSPRGIALWLAPLVNVKLAPKVFFEREDGIFGEIRTLKPGERIRFTWQEGDDSPRTVVQMQLVGRSNGTSILAFNHEKLTDGRAKEQIREHWKSALERVFEGLPKPKPK